MPVLRKEGKNYNPALKSQDPAVITNQLNTEGQAHVSDCISDITSGTHFNIEVNKKGSKDFSSFCNSAP